MRWTLTVAAACALVVAAGACGSTITVPDQGIIVTGCQLPAQCWRSDCDCNFATINSCIDPVSKDDPNDPSTWHCEPFNDLSVSAATPDGGAPHDSQCIEAAQACVGRGPLCGGLGALCVHVGGTCNGTGDPPMLIPTIGMPALEPHCQYVDDVCCPGSTITDGGMSTD